MMYGAFTPLDVDLGCPQLKKCRADTAADAVWYSIQHGGHDVSLEVLKTTECILPQYRQLCCEYRAMLAAYDNWREKVIQWKSRETKY